jgi:hypothetical protein
MMFHKGAYEKMKAELEEARCASALPAEAGAGPALHSLLVRLRIETMRR